MLSYGMSGKVFHAPFINAHPGFELYAVTERSKKEAAERYPNIVSYNSIDALLADASIDLVIVNTPNYLHFEHAIMALSAGKHVLIEKPACADTKDLQQLFDKADAVNKQIFFYQNRRWDSDFLSVKSVLESGKLGKLNEVHFRFDRYRAAISVKAFKEEPVPASGLLYDLGPHLLDQVISIWGEPLSWEKVKGKNRPDTKVDDYFMVHLRYADSLNVYVHGNMMVLNPQPAFVLHGSGGSYSKLRTDRQEEQLIAGMLPDDDAYGIESFGVEGLLMYLTENGELHKQDIPSEKGDYRLLFNALYDTLAKDSIYPISRNEVMTQLRIIEEG